MDLWLHNQYMEYKYVHNHGVFVVLWSCNFKFFMLSLRWRHNGRDGVSNHQPHDCLLNRLFRRRSKKTSKRRVTGLCAGNSPGTGEFPAQMASNAENVSIWWRHHDAFTNILQGGITGTGIITWLAQCQWSNPGKYGWHRWFTNHKTQKVRTVYTCLVK